MGDEKLLVLPPRYAILTEEAKQLRARAAAMELERRAIRKAAMEAAGWVKCCRCFPRAISEDGFCGCCLYNHVTGEQIERPASYFAEEDAPKQEQSDEQG